MKKFLIRTSMIAAVSIILGIGMITAAVASGADVRAVHIDPINRFIEEHGEEEKWKLRFEEFKDWEKENLEEY